jgi:hypothetical protein
MPISTQDRIFASAADVFGRFELDLHPGAEAMLRADAQVAADYINGLSDPQTRRRITEQAQAAFELFALRMVQAAGEIPGYKATFPDSVGEDTHAEASTELRIWPFDKLKLP